MFYNDCVESPTIKMHNHIWNKNLIKYIHVTRILTVRRSLLYSIYIYIVNLKILLTFLDNNFYKIKLCITCSAFLLELF